MGDGNELVIFAADVAWVAGEAGSGEEEAVEGVGGGEGLVSAEEFVGAIAGKDDVDVAGGFPGEGPGGVASADDGGGVVGVDDVGDGFDDGGGGWGDPVDVKVGDVAGNGADVVAFVEAGMVGVMHGEAGEGAVGLGGGEGGDGGGVESAAEPDAEGGVAAEAEVDGVGEEFVEGFDGLGMGCFGAGVEGPGGGGLDVAGGDAGGGAGGGGGGVGEGGVGADVGDHGAKVVVEGLVVGFAEAGVGGEEGFGFGGEVEGVVEDGVDEGFDAEAVAGEDEFLVGFVPKGEGPHAVEAWEAGLAPLGVGVKDDFGVGAGVEGVTEGGELVAEFEVVVDFAVEGEVEGVGSGVHGLMAAGGKVDDAEAAMGEAEAVLAPDAVIVAATVVEGIDHGVELMLVDGLSVAMPDAGDAAHIKLRGVEG